MFCEKVVNGNLRCRDRAKGGPREACTLGAGRVALCESHAQAEYRRRRRCPWPRPTAERAPTSYEEKWIQPSTTDRPQQGRHAHHATQLLATNTHIRVVQERLGHATISVTLGTYSHLIPGLDATAAEAAAAVLRAARARRGGSA